MYKIAVVGDYDSIYGFATLGLDTFPVADRKVAAECKNVIEKYQERILPAIIQIPGVSGNTGDGVQGVKNSVEQAVGSDILFSNN